jgi:hypothetical protein
VFLFWHQAGGKHITTAKSLANAILLIPDLGKSPATPLPLPPGKL